MAVEDISPIISYTYTGAGDYDIPFPVPYPTEVAASVLSEQGVVTQFVYGTDYSIVADEGNVSGVATVTNDTLPSSGTITFVSSLPYTQTVDWANGSNLDMPLLTKAFDKVTMLMQQLRVDAAGLYAQTNWRGFWVADTPYSARDVIIKDNGGNWYQCLVPHTSDDFGQDVAAGNWFLIFDSTQLLGFIDSAVQNADIATTQAGLATDSAYSAIGAAATAQASAETALLAPGTAGTSTTSLAIGTGTKSLTIQTGKLFVPGMGMVLSATASPTTLMHGIITSYDSSTGALVLEVGYTSGSGTYAGWTASLSSVGFGINLRIGLPVGSIIPFVTGYFGAGNNTGFTAVITNTVAGVNAHVAADGFRVCDGSEYYNADSAFFNVAGRFLPNLTDDRFLMGDTSAGTSGGSSSTSGHTHTLSHTHTIAHTHTVNVAAFSSSAVALTIAQMPAHTHQVIEGAYAGSGSLYASGDDYTNTIAKYSTTSSVGGGSSHSHTVDPPNTTSSASSASSSGAASNATTSSHSGAENRPQFLSCFYLMKVI